MLPMSGFLGKTLRRNFYTNTKLAVSAQNEYQNAPSTVAPEDVEHFTKLLNFWWDAQGKIKPLHALNYVRVPFVRDGLVQRSQKNPSMNDIKILDVGCGGGILSESLAATGVNVTGIDASEELIKLAKVHSGLNTQIKDNKPTYYNTTVEEHAKTHPEYYDGVVASEVIEHVNNKELFVKSCVQMLKPGGRIFFTAPNKTRLSQFYVIFLCENVFKRIPKGTHQYEQFISTKNLSSLLEKNNCLVDDLRGLWYDAASNKWKFVKSPAIFYAMRAFKVV